MNQLTHRFNRGFTLIEVLVVILIMGVVMSMISLTSTTPDPLEETLKKSQGFQYWFGKIVDQSLLTGDDVGLYFTETTALALTWREGDLTEAEPAVVWEQNENFDSFMIPESLKLELYLDIELSDWIDLELSPPKEDDVYITPHVVVTPSEEYFPSFSINFYSNEYSDEQVRILADGFNRAKVIREQK